MQVFNWLCRNTVLNWTIMEFIRSTLEGIRLFHLPTLDYLFIGALLTLGILLKLFYPQFAGAMGESKVKSELQKLDKSRYTIVHDVMVELPSGKSAQIDHVIVSQFGIFVIETKNYSGWIFGKEADRNWTQTIYKSKKRFLNPIIQNKGHVKALQTVLNVPLEVFVPIVAFDGGAELKVQVTSPVLHIRKLSAYISDYRQLRLSIDDVQRLAQSITTLNVTDPAKRRAHVQRARAAKAGSRR